MTHFVNVPLSQCTVSSTRHLVNLLFGKNAISSNSFCQLSISSNFHFINFPSHQLSISSTFYFINFTFHQLSISSTFHFINLNFSQAVIFSTHHFFNLAFCQFTVLSPRHFVNPEKEGLIYSTYQLSACQDLFNFFLLILRIDKM